MEEHFTQASLHWAEREKQCWYKECIDLAFCEEGTSASSQTSDKIEIGSSPIKEDETCDKIQSGSSAMKEDVKCGSPTAEEVDIITEDCHPAIDWRELTIRSFQELQSNSHL